MVSTFKRILVLLVFAVLFANKLSAVIRDGGVDPNNLGQGGWIYIMKNATNHMSPNNIPSVTNQNSLMKFLKSQGLSYVIVKAGTSNTLFSVTGGNVPIGSASAAFNSALVDAAHANGLKIFASNRSWGNDIPGEVAVANYAFQQGADGYIFDAESEWESSQPWIGKNGPALAWELCSTIRSNWPTKFIAHNPYDTLYLHSSFPFKEFGYWCDAVMPQVYHHSATMGNAFAAIHWMDVNYRTFQNSLRTLPTTNINGLVVNWTNAIKPLVLMRDVYNGGAGTPVHPDTDVRNFLDYLVADPNCVTEGGYNGSDYFRSELHSPGQWAYIKAATIGSFPGVVNNIVLDDAVATRVGSWTMVKTIDATTGSTVTFSGATGTDTNSFGTNYFSKGQGNGSSYMQFTPKILVDGQYDIYQWHPTRATASTNTPFLISYNGGSTTIYANQTTNNGNWSLLGRFPFKQGTSGYIRILDNFSDPTSIALVDGLKMVYVPPTSAPSAPNNLVATAVSATQINLTWNDTSSNESHFMIEGGTTSGGSYAPLGYVGANATSFSVTNLLANTRYYFVVRATNSFGGSAYSSQATAITLPPDNAPPVITTQPQSQIAIWGTNVTFSVEATGVPTPVYQWRSNGIAIPAATNSSFTLTNVTPQFNGGYSVIVSNSSGSVTSSTAILTVNVSLMVDSSPDGSVSITPGGASYTPGTSVTLTAKPNANAAFYGWSGDTNGTNSSITILLNTNKSVVATFLTTQTNIIVDNSDWDATYVGDWMTGTTSTDKYGPDYRFANSVSGGNFTATYTPRIGVSGYYDVFIWYPQGGNRAPNAPWTIVDRDGITNVPVNQQVNGGKWVLLAAARPFIAGTNNSVRLSNNASPSVVLADAVRFSYAGALPVAPTILTQPQSQSLRAGTNVSFSVIAEGTAPLAYQWSFKNTPIFAATNSSYSKFNIQPADAGAYSVVVSNSAGSVVSSNAMLTVVLPTPPHFESVFQSQDNRIDFILSGDIGITYHIERTTNFVDWEPVTNLFNTNGTMEFFETISNQTRGFYRARE